METYYYTTLGIPKNVFIYAWMLLHAKSIVKPNSRHNGADIWHCL